MQITAIPLLADNYAWLLVDGESRECAVVDASEAATVASRIRGERLTLRTILATHHHWDHTGGIAELTREFSGVEVVCSTTDVERIGGATRTVVDGETISVAGSEAVCLHVPGHTRGAVAYHFPVEQAVFTGDTMFLSGCGRLFEGTPAQMHASLQRLAGLPDETQVYCGHEYTEKNLRFAASIDPDNAAVRERLARVQETLARGEPSVPASIAEERSTNPFLRCSSVEGFADLRARRDRF